MKEFVKGYPTPVCVNVESEGGNYLSQEASAIIAETAEVRGDIENYDSATHMINTVRQALQGIAMGDDAERSEKPLWIRSLNMNKIGSSDTVLRIRRRAVQVRRSRR